jgi:hypothetical protein
LDSELIDGLEPDQLVAASSIPLPLARLSRLWRIGLWALRFFTLLITALVVYTFVANLTAAHTNRTRSKGVSPTTAFVGGHGNFSEPNAD